jgi:hypothetical protein
MRLAPAAVCLVFLQSMTAPTRASGLETRSTSRSHIAAIEHDWLANEHDSTTLDRVLAADFVHALATGQFITKADHVDYMVRHPSAADEQRRFDRLDVRLVAGVAIATGIVVTNNQGTRRRFVFTDVFARRAGRWRAVAAQETMIVPPPA